MAFLGLMLRAGLRHRWRSWLALSLLAAVVIGMVLAGVQTARRTNTAFPRFVAAHGYDSFFYSPVPVSNLDVVAPLATTTPITLAGGGTPTCRGCRPLDNNNFSIQEVPPRQLAHVVKLVSGRMPDQANASEVLASYNLVPFGIHVGSVLHVPLVAASQQAQVFSNQNVTPAGPHVALHVVGLAVSEFEFPSPEIPASYDVYATASFAQKYNASTVLFHEYFFRLHNGAAGLPRFEAAVRLIGGVSGTDMAAVGDSIATSIAPQAVGWWILTGLAALVGLVVLAQALVRQAAVEAEDFPALGAVGASREQLFWATMVRTAFVGVAGAAAGIALALVLSIFTPVGEARLADPNPGFDFDVLLLLCGAATAVAVVVVLGLWPAVSSSRRASYRDEGRVARPSRTVSFLSSSGAPPTMLIGVRSALERGRGRSAIPVGSAVLGMVLAVAVLCGTAVFGDSLRHLTHTPAQYGQNFDAWFSVNGSGNVAQSAQLLRSIERRPSISGITAGVGEPVVINGKVVDAVAGQPVRGAFVIPITSGRFPAANNEVVLGTKTMAKVGARPGSTVSVSLPGPTGRPTKPKPFRVVGTAVLPPGFNAQGLGTGAIVDFGALSGSNCRGGADRSCLASAVLAQSGVYLVRAAPTAQGKASLSALSRAYASLVNFPQPPTSLVNFGEAVNFPLIFGLIVVLFGTATLLHLLLSSLNRRRREIGLLKSLGLVRHQVALCVTWQTTTVALIGIVIGVPLGVAAGRAIWTAFANFLGVATPPVITVWLIVALAAATLFVANLLAVIPALVAARSRPASLLRTE